LCQDVIKMHPWGFLWLERVVSIDTKLIAQITGLPSTREDPLPLFTDKQKDKSLAKKMKDTYETQKGAHTLDVVSINDDTFRFTMQVLACNFLRKFPNIKYQQV